MRKVVLSVGITALAMSVSACSTLQDYMVKAKYGAEQLSTVAADASVYELCEMIRLRDYKRLFSTVEKRKSHAELCSKEQEKVEVEVSDNE